MRDIVLAMFWATALPLSVICPQAGVIFWIWDAILAPTELMYGFMASMPTNKVIAVVTLCRLATEQYRRDVYWDKTVTLLCIIALCATGSYLSALSIYPDDFDLYTKILKEGILVLAICWTINDRKWLETTIFGLIIAISFLGVKEGLISLLTIGGHKIVGSRALGDNNQLAAMLVVTLPLIYYLIQRVENRTVRIGLLGVMLLNVTTVIMTFSRGGFVGLVAVAALLLRGSRHKVRTAALLTFLAFGIFTFAPDTWFSRVNTIESADADSSFMGRVNAWKVSWLIAEDNPLLGGGPHAVQHWSVWVQYMTNFHKLDFIPTPLPELIPKAAHSIYFEVLGDLGWSGFIAYMILFIIALNNCKQMRRVAYGNPALGWAGDLGDCLRISIVAYLLTGALLSIAYQEMLFILIAFASRGARSATYDALTIKTSVKNDMQRELVNTVQEPLRPVQNNIRR